MASLRGSASHCIPGDVCGCVVVCVWSPGTGQCRWLCAVVVVTLCLVCLQKQELPVPFFFGVSFPVPAAPTPTNQIESSTFALRVASAALSLGIYYSRCIYIYIYTATFATPSPFWFLRPALVHDHTTILQAVSSASNNPNFHTPQVQLLKQPRYHTIPSEYSLLNPPK